VVEKSILDDLRRAGTCRLPRRFRHGRKPSSRARRRLRRSLRRAALAAVIPQEAPRKEIPQPFPGRRLPLLDSLKIIALDAQEPIKSEFKAIVETQTIGMPIGEACAKLYERMPLPEANFFGIVISIQQKAGGNLSEALGNLSRVLRDRKKMKAKIQAMSMEAKASASIIGALPLCVGILVWLTSPDYIELLWTAELGRFMMMGCVVWMSIGIFVMKKMINFDF
jgi:tight adherence protein B